MMSTTKKSNGRLKTSQIPKRKVNLKWRANFWEFVTENQDDVDYIIDSNIYAAYLSPERSYAFASSDGTTPEDLHSDILVKLYESDFLRHFDERRKEYEEAKKAEKDLPPFGGLSTYLTSKVRGYISHALRRVDRPYRHLGPDKENKATRVFDRELNGGNEEAQILPGNHETDSRAILNELFESITKNLSRESRDVFILRAKEYTQREIADMFGCSAVKIGNTLNGINTHTRKKYNQPLRKKRVRKIKEDSEQIVESKTLKGQIVEILKVKGSLTLAEIYQEVKKFRPDSPKASVRGRIYTSILKGEGIFLKMGCGRYGLNHQK